ncbi:hypothetical protein sscle_02g017560 [Sclerotinia sclerotiorum 1980 UF-70]|uniref:Major facilitator superfamily (MFS) profile domain-containing protein n=1 Tax=Sclerotinia sclerotiorum (strain ATCC 18683 / 1980 / Ss-1) TaxID=665079 RepID=A0A1D9PWH0_SCLS1|nr:hypothetical protein sscle_02g017560 [Sclerotinia sclerotiorum 1980 UF-70]
MAAHETDTIHKDDSSQASSRHANSIKSSSETDSLLSPVTATSTPNYKSTSTFPDVESAQNVQAENETTGRVTKSAAIIISLLLIGVFISYADGTLVLATYGTIASEFRALGDASWLTTSYSLAMCAVQPLTGKISDIYGRKPVLLISYGFFVIGCVLTGLSQAMWQTVMGRVVAGMGGAGMSVMVSVLIVDLVPLIHVAAWRSYVNVVGTIGRSIGGPLGGLLADTIGWRWSFIGQGPLMLFAIVLVAYKLPTRSLSDEPIHADDGPSRLRRIDFVGAFMLTGTIAAFLAALSLAGQALPWSHPIVIGLLLGSVLLGAVFVSYEIKVATEPIFPPALAIQRDVAASYAINALQLGAQVGMMYSVPLYFRVTQGSSNTTAGLHLFPAVFGNTTGGLLAGWLISRTGHYKYLLTLSTLSSIFSYTILLTTWHSNNLSLVSSLAIFPGGFGLGITAACTFIALTVSVQKNEMGMATAGMYLMSSIGTVVGVALCAGVQNSALGEALGGLGLDDSVVRKVMSDVGSVKDLHGNIRLQVIEAYVKSLEASHAVSVGLSALAFLVSLVVREKKIM